MKGTSLPLICRAVTRAASPVGRPAPRNYHQGDDAEQRGGHQVIGGRQRIAGLRDQPRRRKRGESAEDRYGYAEAERHSDGARFDWKLLRQHRRQDAAVTCLDQVEEADGEYRGGERGKGDHQPKRRIGGEQKQPGGDQHQLRARLGPVRIVPSNDREDGEDDAPDQANNGSFYVSVRDTGPGISAADQTRLFQEFQQADNAITRKKG